MTHMTATSYHVRAANVHRSCLVAACHRDAVAVLGDRVGMRVTVEHYGHDSRRGTLSLTAYRRVKAGWRVVRQRRLGGLRWQRRGL